MIVMKKWMRIVKTVIAKSKEPKLNKMDHDGNYELKMKKIEIENFKTFKIVIK